MKKLFSFALVLGALFLSTGAAEARHCGRGGRAGAVLDRPHLFERVRGVIGRIIHRR